ncbi:MAG: tetratricopeptide repeat protein [Kiritimatiellae bacterium]|nr:tetratricopeptide repeat protein [Kiritimatiellia bacterium]
MRLLRNAHLSAVVAIAAAVFAVYINALWNGLVWDDEALIANNPHIRSWKNVPLLFSSQLFAGSGKISRSYRPLQALTYMADHSVWGLNPVGYHLTNMMLHAICAVLVYAVMILILNERRVAFVTGLIFGIHPVHTEAVTYVAGRADPLMGSFFLAGLCLFILFRTRQAGWGWAHLLGLALAYGLGLLSKEYGAFLVLVMLLYDAYHRPRHGLLRVGLPYLIAGAVFAGYMWLRAGVDFPVSEMALSSAVPPPLWERILNFPKALAVYMGLLLVPMHLYMQRGLSPVEGLADICLIGALVVAALLVYAIVRTYRNRRHVSFGLAWFLLMLLPLSDTVYPLNAGMAEHWLFVPSIGFIAAAVGLVTNRREVRGLAGIRLCLGGRAALVLLAGFTLFLGVRTIVRNRDWKDNFTIWSRTAEHVNTSAIHGNLAVAYWEGGNTGKAIEELQYAIELQENYPEAHYNLGYIYAAQGKRELAEAEFRLALRYRPSYEKARKRLAEIGGQ